MFDAKAIAQTAWVSPRTVRYVIDHMLIPSLAAMSGGRGRARTFDGYNAFLVAVAASLLDTGFTGDKVRELMGRLTEKTPKKCILERAYDGRSDKPQGALILRRQAAAMCLDWQLNDLAKAFK